MRGIIVAIKQRDNRVFILKKRLKPRLHQLGHFVFVILVFGCMARDFQHAAAAAAVLVFVQGFGQSVRIQSVDSVQQAGRVLACKAEVINFFFLLVPVQRQTVAGNSRVFVRPECKHITVKAVRHVQASVCPLEYKGLIEPQQPGKQQATEIESIFVLVRFHVPPEPVLAPSIFLVLVGPPLAHSCRGRDKVYNRKEGYFFHVQARRSGTRKPRFHHDISVFVPFPEVHKVRQKVR